MLYLGPKTTSSDRIATYSELGSGGGSSYSVMTVEKDLGSIPTTSGKFTVNTVGQTVGNPIIVMQASGPYTGKGTLADESSVDMLSVNAYASSATTIECFWTSQYAVKGNFKFNLLNVTYPTEITSFTPTEAAPGESVVITGTGFSTATSVTFGGIAASSFTINSNFQITAVVPSGALAGSVTVTSSIGTSSLVGFVNNVSAFKLSLLNGANTVVHEEDSLETMCSWINSSYTINSNITVRFNTSDTHALTNTLSVNFTNGSYTVTFKNKVGHTPIVDIDYTNATGVVITSPKVVWDGVEVRNAFSDSNENGGTIFRIDGVSDLTIKNCKIKRGWVGVRGTSGIYNLTIDNVIFEECEAGVIRLGATSFSPSSKWEDFDSRNSFDYDIHNISITNIICSDTLAGGNVPGTTNKASSLILVKQCEGLTLQSIYCKGSTGDFISIEGSTNVLINRVLSDDAHNKSLSVIGTDFLTVANCFFRNNVGTSSYLVYFDTVRNIKLLYNSFISTNQFDALLLQKLRRVLQVIGNLVNTDYETPLSFSIATLINSDAYTPSLAVDFQEEYDNTLISNNAYNDILYVSGVLPGNTDLRVRVNNVGAGQISLTTYKATYPGYGLRDNFSDTNNLNLSTRVNPDTTTSDVVYLSDGALGRDSITTYSELLAEVDLAGYSRTTPMDAGAYDRDATI